MSRTSPAPRARKPGAERRVEIARAALRLLGERGGAALNTAALAEAVGVSGGALFRHFPSLDAVLEEALRLALEQVEATFPDPSLPPLERLGALLGARVRLLGADPGLAWLLRADEALQVLPPAAGAALRQLVARTRATLLEALREGAAAGTVRGDVPPELLLLTVMGTAHALVGLTGAHRGAAGAPRPEAALEGLLRLLAPPAPPPRSPRAPKRRATAAPTRGRRTR